MPNRLHISQSLPGLTGRAVDAFNAEDCNFIVLPLSIVRGGGGPIETPESGCQTPNYRTCGEIYWVKCCQCDVRGSSSACWRSAVSPPRRACRVRCTSTSTSCTPSTKTSGMHEGDNTVSKIKPMIPSPAAVRRPGRARISGDRFALLLPARRGAGGGVRGVSTGKSPARLDARQHAAACVDQRRRRRAREGQRRPGPCARRSGIRLQGRQDRGRNRVDVYGADVSIIRRFTDITTAGELREAIASNRFVSMHQIINQSVPLRTHPTHFELLLRDQSQSPETVGLRSFPVRRAALSTDAAIDR